MVLAATSRLAQQEALPGVDPAEEWLETVAKASGPLRAIGAREVEA
jgi:hypothetical protein